MNGCFKEVWCDVDSMTYKKKWEVECEEDSKQMEQSLPNKNKKIYIPKKCLFLPKYISPK